MDLIPPALLVARYFAAEQVTVDQLQAAQEAVAQALEEFVEEHTGDEGLLEEAANDKGKVAKAGIRERLRQLKTGRGQLTLDAEDAAEAEALERCLALIDAEAEASKAVSEAQAAWTSGCWRATPRAGWGVIRNFVVAVPPLQEQIAIATVLSDMDAETAALERRRDKAKQIKQGRMQELLTGRTRLV